MKSLGDVGAGHTLGRYELLLPIAQGGMAVVWAARMKGTRGFQKTVAVKSMLPALTDDAQFEEMFLAEAELASQIRHPHVCEILDLGEQEGILYIVMEWVDGEPMSAIQKASRQKGGIPIGVATRICFHAAQGLHAAHELKKEGGDLVGLVHRDVSPQNILITYDGVVKIVDFGVAKATSQADQSHTQVGQVKGKVPFMSPEQALGKPVDRRTDVFALGIVLYQAVTGKHPFRGENDMATLHKICDPAPVPAPSTINPKCTPALDAAILKALEKDVAKRFPNMLELARALEKALAELTAAGDGDQELGAFVRSVVGDKAEKRRAAIKEAIRLADERTEQRKLNARGSGPTLDGSTAPIPPISEVSAISLDGSKPISGITGVPISTPGGAPVTPASFDVPDLHAFAPPPRQKKPAVIAAALIALAGIGVGALLLTRTKPQVEVSTHTLGGEPPAATPTPASPPTPSVTAAATAEPAPPASAEPAATGAATAEPDKTKPTHHVGGGGRPRATATATAAATAAPATTTGPAVPKIRNPGF